MRTTRLILIVLLLSLNAQAQIDKKNIYKLTSDNKLKEVDLEGKTPNEPEANQEEGFRFKIDKVIGDKYVIKFLKWRNNKINNDHFFRKSDGQRRYFSLPVANFEDNAEVVHPRYSFTFGTMTLPVKIRFGSVDSVNINKDIRKKRDFNFTADVNLGLVLGGKFNVSDDFKIIFPLIGFNVSSIAADSASTNGYLNTEANLASITPYTGIIFQIKTIQLGITTGMDFPSGQAGYNWDYRNQPWLGIGIGFSIFTSDVSETKQ